jgi:fatty acid desaturase
MVQRLTDILARPELTEKNLRGLVADTVKKGGRTATIDWATVFLAIFIYSGWLTVTWFYQSLPVLVFLLLVVPLTTWQTSLQHEVLHGHPTRWRRINRLFAMAPLIIWLPYERYRQTHLTHHIDERLTDPIDDPESYYVTREAFGLLSRAARLIVWAQTTLAGRLLFGPFWSGGNFLADEARRVVRNEGNARAVWFEHAVWCIPVLVWLFMVCGIPVWLYLLFVMVPATSLMMVRSFAEHRGVTDQQERTAIVENSWILGPIFLFNNLHVVHHEAPLMPWYKLPGWYRANREAVLRSNGGLVYNTYFDVARRFLLRPHDTPTHPLNRIPRN